MTSDDDPTEPDDAAGEKDCADAIDGREAEQPSTEDEQVLAA